MSVSVDERFEGSADRVLVAASAEDGEEDRLGIGRADPRAVELVRDQRFDLAAYAASSCRPSPLCMNIQRPQANGWQFGRVIGVPVEARTCAK